MSGENRRPYGWFLPVIVVAVGAYFLISASRSVSVKNATRYVPSSKWYQL